MIGGGKTSDVAPFTNTMVLAHDSGDVMLHAGAGKNIYFMNDSSYTAGDYTAWIDSYGVTSKHDFFLTPSTPTDTTACTAGQFKMDDNYIYVCGSNSLYKRAALSAF